MRFASVSFSPCFPTSRLKKETNLHFIYLIALKKSVQVLKSDIRRTFFFFSPVFPLCWANLEHIGASALKYK